MKKKHLLKMNGKMKAMCLGLTGLMLGIDLGGSAFAGNIKDTWYVYNSSRYGFASPTRDKTDATSAYIRHVETDNAYVKVMHM